MTPGSSGPRWLPARLQRRLQALVGIAVLATLILHGWYTIDEQSAQARRGLENQALSLARTLSAATEAPIITGNLTGIEELILHSINFSGVRSIRVLDAQGHPLGGVAREPGQEARLLLDPKPLDIETLGRVPRVGIDRSATHERVVAVHPIEAGNLLGWVRVEFDTDQWRKNATKIGITSVVAGLLALTGMAALLALLLRAPMRALDEARRFAVSLKAPQGQRLDVADGSIETHELAQALNQASTALYESHVELQDAVIRLRKQETVLRDSNTQLATIFAVSPDGLATFDKTGRLKFANGAFHRLVGLAAHQAPTLTIQSLDEHLRAASTGSYPGLDASFEDASDRIGDQGERSNEGRLRVSLARPAPVVLEVVSRHGSSDSAHRLLYLRDITHEFEVDRMKSEFLAAAAHELRTPMSTIYGFTELMMHAEFSAERRQSMLGKVYRQSQAMMEIVDRLLDLSRMESRQASDFDFERVDLRTVVSDTIDGLVTPERRDRPALALPETPCWVRADARRLTNALKNVLSNAYKYSEAGTPVSVRVGRGAEGRVEVVVTDHGIGMTPEQSARVFERFYRADPTGNRLGTGLGMSVVKEVIQLHDGSVRVDSTPGEGTTVTIRLPLIRAVETVGSSTLAA